MNVRKADANQILAGFSDEMKLRKVRLHGAVLMQNGNVIGETYNHPYTSQTKTRMYSASKSVAAVAIGKLVKENKISLDDKITDVFANRFDMSQADERLKEQTIRDMLCMSTVYSTPTYNASNRDWLASYFRGTPTHYCRTIWNYDSCGSYVLGALTEHLTGKDFVEYLRPEFDVMSVSEGVYCIKGPDGEAWASSGFMATTSDLARIAYLLLNKGRWNDIQLIPEDYAAAAISPLVMNDDTGVCTRYKCGYGYQIWSFPNGAFSFRGLGGQVAIGFPGRDLVFACNSDTSGCNNAYDDIFNAVESIILPEFEITDREEYDRAQPKPVTENVFESIRGKTFALEKNNMKIESVRFTESNGEYELHYYRAGSEKSIKFGIGNEISIVFPEKYTGSPLFDADSYTNYHCSAVGEWTEKRKLLIRVWAEDTYVGNMTMCFSFREDGKLGIWMHKYAQFFFENFHGIACGEITE